MAEKAEKTTIEALQSQLKAMEDLLRRSGILPAGETRSAKQTDYIEFGSDKHAMILGLKKAGADDKIEYEGWTLQDVTAFGPTAREEYIREILRSKVSTLKAGPPPIPEKPTLWRPSPDDLVIR